MVEVSDKFKRLAEENGRYVYCRIEADGEVFLDDRLIDFDFDDVVHPDWVTIGTACANRFHFTARFDGELAVNAEVRPYVSFDNEEWCPLGVFYISRRYVRGGVISVTAYDKMYSLDTEYAYEGTLPTTSSAILKDICEKTGLEAVDYGLDIEVEKLPSCCTARDMISYIAGINFRNAKIDRYGRLCLKRANQNGDNYYINKKNCIDIRKNLTRSVITTLVVTTEDEVLKRGDGAELSTVEMYNPLVTEDMMVSLLSRLSISPFYGADIEMQGMPFLEAGEIAQVIVEGDIFTIYLSEIEYHYNGGLTAAVHSRNRTADDNPDYLDDLEEALRRLTLSHTVVCMRQDNAEQISISTDPVVIADFTFETAGESFAQLDLSMSLSQSNAGGVLFTVYCDGADSGRHIIHSSDGSGTVLTHLNHLQPFAYEGSHRLYVTAQTNHGTEYIPQNAMQAALVIHGGKYDSGEIKNRLAAHDVMTVVKLSPTGVEFAEITGNVQCTMNNEE